jgi:hypothetical protein
MNGMIRQGLVSVAWWTAISSPLSAAILNLRDAPFSAAGDGKTDDRSALANALAAAKPGDTVFVPPGQYRIVLGKGQRLTVPAGVKLLGNRGGSRFLLGTDGGEKDHREFLQPGSGSVLQGLTIVRDAAYPAVLFPLFSTLEKVTFKDVEIEGNAEQYSGYCHGFQVGNGSLKGLHFDTISISGCTFGLFQANQAKGGVEDVLVENSRFARNTSSDLEFNSPNGKMSNVTVRNCFFRENKSKGASGGFAVGFANVSKGTVENCMIQGYGSEALHVEDRSEDILLKGNTIVGGSTIQTNGVILVVNDSRRVVIEQNHLDARPNTNKTHLILVTAGGPKFKNPSDVTVRGNVLINGSATKKWYLQSGSGPAPEENLVFPANAP